MEDVQGVLTLFCNGAAQVVCHALRVEELSGQLEVEEEDGDKQEEEEEAKGEVESRRVRHVDDHGWRYESAQDLSHEVCVYHHNCEQCAQAQCMLWYATRPSKCKCIVSTSSLVYLLLCIMSCLLLYASFQFYL